MFCHFIDSVYEFLYIQVQRNFNWSILNVNITKKNRRKSDRSGIDENVVGNVIQSTKVLLFYTWVKGRWKHVLFQWGLTQYSLYPHLTKPPPSNTILFFYGFLFSSIPHEVDIAFVNNWTQYFSKIFLCLSYFWVYRQGRKNREFHCTIADWWNKSVILHNIIINFI